MKTRTLISGTLALLLLVSLSAGAAEQTTKFTARPGSKMRMEGTANIIHTHWAVESPIIGGFLEVGPKFPTEPGQAATPGKVEAKAESFIMVNSLRSIEDDGKYYSDRMDQVMYEHLKADKFKRIEYRLSELVLKEAPKTKDTPYVFDAKGDLIIAGVTNAISMPVSITPLGTTPQGEKKLKITGSVAVTMSSFKLEPVSLTIGGVGLKAGDEVKLSWVWNVTEKTAPAAK
jgi:polyisoprenoid-binding protein YceI